MRRYLFSDDKCAGMAVAVKAEAVLSVILQDVDNVSVQRLGCSARFPRTDVET